MQDFCPKKRSLSAVEPNTSPSEVLTAVPTSFSQVFDTDLASGPCTILSCRSFFYLPCPRACLHSGLNHIFNDTIPTIWYRVMECRQGCNGLHLSAAVSTISICQMEWPHPFTLGYILVIAVETAGKLLEISESSVHKYQSLYHKW